MKKGFGRNFALLIAFLSLLISGCDSWMTGDHFFDTIAEEVKYANAENIPVFVRYPNRDMGETSPNGNSTQKVDIPFTITAVDANAYGFYKWAAFSTEDFKTIRQYSDILFTNDEQYEQSLAQKELPETEVVFEDKMNPVTTVKVLNNRRDVFIMPICVERPYVDSTNPVDKATEVVKNSQISIVFSSPMDSAYLIDSDGSLNYDYVNIQPFMGAGEHKSWRELEDYLPSGTKMMASLSPSKKTLTITLPQTNPPTYFPRMSFNISVSSEVRDILGYEMAKNYDFSFSAGSELDQTCPMVMVLEVGTTSLHKNTSDNDDIPRVGPKLNFRAWISDKTKSTDTEGVETNVALIKYVVERIQDPDSSVNLAAATIDRIDEEFSYVPGGNLSISPYVDSPDATGIILPIDLTAYSDGLWKLTVWATDMTGNEGDVNDSKRSLETGDEEAPCKYLYFIKDTQAPTGTECADQIVAGNADAPYGWFNRGSMEGIQVKESSAGVIRDNPNFSNVFKSPKVWWAFYVGNDSESWKNSMTAESDAWQEVSSTDVDLSTLLTNSIDVNSVVDGVVEIFAMFKDDVGNVSDLVNLQAVKFDGTKPAAGTMSWISPDGVPAGFASGKDLTDQTLVIPFTESLSGVKRISISVEGPSGTFKKAFDNTDFRISVKDAEGNLRPLALDPDTPKPTVGGVQNCLIASAPVSSTTDTFQNALYLENLRITDAADVPEGNYTLKVKLYDSALNESEVEKSIVISVDTVNPVIKEIFVEDAVQFATQAEDPDDDDTYHYYLPSTVYDSSVEANKVTLDISVKEQTSGLYTLTLGGKASLTESSVVSVKDSSGTAISAPFTLDTVTNTVTFTEKLAVKDATEAGVTIKITNVLVEKTDGSRSISVSTKDYAMRDADNNGFSTLSFDGDSSPYSFVYMDPANSSPAAPSSFTVTGVNEGLPSGYARGTDVNAVVTFPVPSGSGLKKIKFTGLKFNSSIPQSQIWQGGNRILDYGLEDDGSTIVLDYPVTSGTDVTLTFKNMILTSTTQGSNSLSVKYDYLAGWQSPEKTTSIIYDSVNPEIGSGSMQWVVMSGSSENPGVSNAATVSNQYLMIPVTETNSGVHKIKIEVTQDDDDGNTLDTSCASIAYLGYSDTSSSSNGGGSSVSYTNSGNEITISYPATYGKHKYYYIRGIKISDSETMEEGNYTLHVTLCDYSGNVSEEKTIVMSNDSTKPVVSKAWFDGIVNTALNPPRTYTTQSTNNTLFVKLTENGAGLKTIYLNHYSGYDPYKSTYANCRNIYPTSSTKLYKSDDGGTTYTEVTGISVSTSSRVITIPQEKAIRGTDVILKITALEIGDTSKKNDCAASVRLDLTDYATNENTHSNTVGTDVAAIAEDSAPSSIKSGYSVISDSGKTLSGSSLLNDSSSITAYSGYTNSPVVDLEFRVSEYAWSSDVTAPSGLRVIKLEGASFIADSAKNGTNGTYVQWVEYCNSDGGHANFNSLTSTGGGNTSTDSATYKGQYFIESKTSIEECGFGTEESKTGFYLVGDKTLVFRTPMNVWDNFRFYLKNIKLDSTSSDGTKSVTVKVFDTASQLASTCSTNAQASVSITYCADKPSISLFGSSSTDLETISSADDINRLVPMNYGIQAYVDTATSRVFVYTAGAKLGTRTGTVNSPSGSGAYKGDNNYVQYFNLNITSSSCAKLYKYAWTTNSALPSSWNSTSSSYKVNVNIPSIVPDVGDNEGGVYVYLHVADYAGNVTTKRMSQYKWVDQKKSTDNLTFPKLKENVDKKYLEERDGYDHCYIEYAGPDGDGNPVFRLTLPKSALGRSQKIYVPENWFERGSGGKASPIYGYSLGYLKTDPAVSGSVAANIANAKRDANGPYLELPASKSDGSFDGFNNYENHYDTYVYIYDSCGGYLTTAFYVTIDQTPPVFEVGVLQDDGQTPEAGVYTKWEGSSYINNYKTRFSVEPDGRRHIRQRPDSDQENTTKGASATNPIVLYVNTNNPEIQLWTNSTDVLKFTCSVDGGTASEVTIDNTNDGISTNYIRISPLISETGTLYRYSAVDKGANESVIYFKAYYDHEGPAITPSNVTNVNTITETGGTKINYFGSTATAKITVADALVGLASTNGGFSTSSTNLTSLTYSSSDKSLKVSASDVFGNATSSSIEYSESNKWVKDETKPGTPSLVYSGYGNTNNTISSDYDNPDLHADGLFVSGSGNTTTVKFTGSVKKITIKPNAADSNPSTSSETKSGIMGYVLLNSTSGLKSFYSKNEVFTSTTGTEINVESIENTATKYVYAVDKAGNPSSTPLTLELVLNTSVPRCTNLTGSGIYTNSANTLGWFSSSAYITPTVTNSPTSYVIDCDNKGYELVLDSYTYPSNISIPSRANGANRLSIAFMAEANWGVHSWIIAPNGVVGRSTTETNTTWTLDSTAPTANSIEVDSVTTSSSGGKVYKASGTKIYYNGSTTSLTITPKATDNDGGSGIKGFALSESGTPSTTLTVDVSGTTPPSSVTIYACDNVGNRNSRQISLEKDTAVPTVDFDSATMTNCKKIGDTFYYASTSGANAAKLTLPITDSGSGLAATSLQNNAEIILGDYFIAGVGIKIPSGRIKDNVDNTTDYTLPNVVQDLTAPGKASSVTNASSTGGNAYLSGSTVFYNASTTALTLTLSGATDNTGGSGVAGYAISGRTDVTSTATTITIPLGEGFPASVAIKTVDGVGNESSAALTVTLTSDTSAPTVEISSIPSGYGKTYSSTDKVFFKDLSSSNKVKAVLSISDTGSGLASSSWQNGKEIYLSDYYAAATEALSISTSNVLDNVGNTSSYFLTYGGKSIVKDEMAPNPATGFNVSSVTGSGAKYFVSGTATDGYYPSTSKIFYNSSTSSVKLSFNGASDGTGSGVAGYSTSSTGTPTTGPIEVSVSNSSVTVYAIDNLGNASTAFTVELQKDDAIPDVSITSISGGRTYVDGSNYYIRDDGDSKVKATLSISDGTGSGLASGDGLLASGDTIEISGSISSGSISLASGKVKDNVGNTGSYTLSKVGGTTYNFIKDVAGPSAPTGFKVNSASGDGNAYFVSGTASGGYFPGTSTIVYYNASTSTVELAFNGASDGTTGSGVKGYATSATGTPTSTVTVDVSGDDAPASVTIYAFDNLLNAGTDYLTVTLTKDAAAPVVSIDSLSNAETYTPEGGETTYFKDSVSGSAVAVLSITDAGSGLGTGSLMNGATLILSDNVSEGNLAIASGEVKDKVGNTEAYALTYGGKNLVLDETGPAKPSVSSISATGGDYYQDGDTIYFSGSVTALEITPSATDGGCGLKGYSLSADGTPIDKVTINVSSVSSSTSKSIYAIDYLGNASEALSLTLTKDDSVPTVSISGITGGKTYINGSNYYFKDASDADKVNATLSVTDSLSGIPTSGSLADGSTVTVSELLNDDGKIVIPSGDIKDNVGNTQSYVLNKVGASTYTFIKDEGAPTDPTGFRVSASIGSGAASFVSGTKNGDYYPAASTVYYNGSTTKLTLMFDLSSASDGTTGSGVKGVALSDDATPGETVSIDVSGDTPPTSVVVYTYDNLGNKSTGVTISLVKDAAAPVAGAPTLDGSMTPASIADPKNANNLTYTVNVLSSGSKVIIPITEDGVGFKRYNFFTSTSENGTPSASGWKDAVSENGYDASTGKLTLDIPLITDVSTSMILLLEDNLGNVTQKNASGDYANTYHDAVVRFGTGGWCLTEDTSALAATYKINGNSMTVTISGARMAVSKIEVTAANITSGEAATLKYVKNDGTTADYTGTGAATVTTVSDEKLATYTASKTYVISYDGSITFKLNFSAAPTAAPTSIKLNGTTAIPTANITAATSLSGFIRHSLPGLETVVGGSGSSVSRRRFVENKTESLEDYFTALGHASLDTERVDQIAFNIGRKMENGGETKKIGENVTIEENLGYTDEASAAEDLPLSVDHSWHAPNGTVDEVPVMEAGEQLDVLIAQTQQKFSFGSPNKVLTATDAPASQTEGNLSRNLALMIALLSLCASALCVLLFRRRRSS